MQRCLALIAFIGIGIAHSAALAQQFDPNAGNRPNVVSPPPEIDPDTPICVLVPMPDEPTCPADDDEARNWVIIINQFACAGECDLGLVAPRLADGDRNLIAQTTGFDVEGDSTRTLSFGGRFTGEGVTFEAAFIDQAFVMSVPISLSASDHGITRLRTVSVIFRSGRTALISFSFTPFRVRP